MLLGKKIFKRQYLELTLPVLITFSLDARLNGRYSAVNFWLRVEQKANATCILVQFEKVANLVQVPCMFAW